MTDETKLVLVLAALNGTPVTKKFEHQTCFCPYYPQYSLGEHSTELTNRVFFGEGYYFIPCTKHLYYYVDNWNEIILGEKELE